MLWEADFGRWVRPRPDDEMSPVLRAPGGTSIEAGSLVLECVWVSVGPQRKLDMVMPECVWIDWSAMRKQSNINSGGNGGGGIDDDNDKHDNDDDGDGDGADNDDVEDAATEVDKTDDYDGKLRTST